MFLGDDADFNIYISYYRSGGDNFGVLARTTFVLESLPEAKNPGQDAIFWGFCPEK